MSLTYKEIIKYYSDEMVQKEIFKFSMQRWVGIHCVEKDMYGRRRLIRYFGKNRVPLHLDRPATIMKFLKIFEKFRPRTFYATANLYKQLMRTEDVMDISNIIACAPTWDIDNRLDDWKATVAAACEIISFLEKNGVEQSIIIKYSGRGIHVQIHPMAVSQELRRKTNPLDLAFATVEYVNSKIRQSLLDLKIQFKADALRVDNEMDTQRLFTCPLSLHKDLDKVCVCMSLDELENFTPEWGDPHSFKHNPSWDKFLAGEADRLASLAYSTVGGCPSIPKMRRRRHPPIDKQIVDLTSQLAEKHPPDAY